MATLQTTDGRLLRSRPAGPLLNKSSMFRPMWTNGEDDVPGTALKSFGTIYRTQPMVAGVVDKLARRIATLPFDAYRKKADGSREQVHGDSLDSLLRRPMPRTSGVNLLHHIAQSLLIHGNALVAMLRGSDPDAPPIMLWPLDWAQTSAYGEQGGRIEWWSTLQFGPERFIAAVDTLHFAWPAPDGSEIGVSALEKLGITLRLEDAAQRFQTAQFANGNRPSLAVTLDHANPKKELLDLTRANIENLHKGPDRSGKTILLGAGAKVQTLSMSPVEAALIEQRKLDREEVGMVYDLAGPLMNDLTHGTYSNVEELNRGLYRDVVPPWTQLIIETFQTQMIDQQPAWLDHIVAFDFADKLKGTPAELAATLKLQVESGLITRNEARRILNMPPLGDPNDRANPANQATANINNQAPLGAMATDATTVPPAG
jgi:HK97 family phage portal protein